MSPRLVNLLLGVAIAAAAAILVWSGDGGSDGVARTAARDPDTITHITIRRRERDTIELQRAEGAWRMTAPLEGPANPARINAMLGLLVPDADPRLPAGEHDASTLGLDPPGVILLLDDLEFRFGTTSPLDGRRYLQHGSAIRLIPDTLYPQLTQRPGFFLEAGE